MPNWWEDDPTLADAKAGKSPSSPSWAGDPEIGAAVAPSGPPEPMSPTREEVPLSLRLAVGTARSDDQLPTLRQTYPDAAPSPTGKGSFVFTSPRTGQPTYFNSPGFDMGDIAASTRMGAEAAGGAAGAMLGAPFGGPAGSLVGGGLGVATADKLVDMVRSLWNKPQTYKAGDTAGDLAQGMAGEAMGQAAGAAVKAGIGSVIRPGAEKTMAAAADAGVPLTARMVGRGPIPAMETSAAQVLPFSPSQRVTNKLYDVATGKIEGIKPDVPVEPANLREATIQGGGALRTAADRAYDTFKAERLKIDNEFYANIPQGVKIKLPGVAQAVGDIRAQVAQSPGVAGTTLKPALDWADRIEADLAANGGALPAEGLRRLRTNLGAELDTRATTELAAPAQNAMRQMYGALNKDVYGAAKAVAPKAADALERHDALVKGFRGENLGKESTAGALDSILKSNSDEAAWSAFNSPQGGVERMRKLVGTLNPDEHKIIARSTFERMTTTPQGNTATPTQWATKWLATPKEQKQLLFGKIGVDVDKMDSLATVLRAQAEGGAATGVNTSRTAYELQRVNLANQLGRAAAVLIGGGGGASAMGILGPLINTAGSAYLASGLVSSQAILKAAVRTATGPAVTTPGQRLLAQGLARGMIRRPPYRDPQQGY